MELLSVIQARLVVTQDQVGVGKGLELGYTLRRRVQDLQMDDWL